MMISIFVLILGALAYTSLEGVDILYVLNANHKLVFFDSSLDGKFSIIGLLSGWLLLNIAAFGLDQDMTQRVLTCKSKDDASRSLILSIIMMIPIV